MLGASHALNCPRGRKNYPCPAPHTTDEDTKAQRNAVTCPFYIVISGCPGI